MRNKSILHQELRKMFLAACLFCFSLELLFLCGHRALRIQAAGGNADSLLSQVALTDKKQRGEYDFVWHFKGSVKKTLISLTENAILLLVYKNISPE